LGSPQEQTVHLTMACLLIRVKISSNMMRLPEFTSPNLSDDELWAEQERLQKQALRVIDLGIIDLLRKYGDIEIDGSYDYGLMVYPDIDTSSIISDAVDLNLFADLCSDIVRQPYVRKITTANTHDHGTTENIARPDGYWVGIEIGFENDFWGVDTWMMNPTWSRNEGMKVQKPRDYKTELTALDAEQKTAILRMKYMAIFEKIYGDKILSTTVYDAVLDHGITDYDSLKSFLKIK